jgi:hypothetical protein
VASHLIRVRGPHHSLQLHHVLQRGKMSRPFYADLLSGSLEVAARARRPFLQSFGPTGPASRNNKFLKYNKFPSFFPSSFYFLYLIRRSENFPLLGQSNVLDHARLRVLCRFIY